MAVCVLGQMDVMILSIELASLQLGAWLLQQGVWYAIVIDTATILIINSIILMCKSLYDSLEFRLHKRLFPGCLLGIGEKFTLQFHHTGRPMLSCMPHLISLHPHQHQQYPLQTICLPLHPSCPHRNCSTMHQND